MRGLLRLLLLPAAVLGVAVENEICPADRAETKICSARQDFVVVVDRSYSRRPYFEEFKLFLKGFGEAASPPNSVVPMRYQGGSAGPGATKARAA